MAKDQAPKPKVVSPTEPTMDVKVTVNKSAPAVKTLETKTTEPELTVHHELTIQPPAEDIDALISSVEPSAAPKPTDKTPVAEKVEPPKPVEVASPEESDKVVPSSTEASASGAAVATPAVNPSEHEEKPSVAAETPKTEPSNTKAIEDKEMQSPKVFDTKKYHLPIDEGVAGGKGKLLMVFVIVLLLAVVSGVVAIDAGWLDAGFDLPFDLIK